ncbi:hypothetical protein [Kaistia nematophila]|uniref:Uncharacterized protein n=1 Tax=Kaistia nematophila TaxID=2994654 RepID=A0A9X3E4Z9_9HYPH|nr:hypothetical protein [Kaistia nematophila]MCX5571452.1 hypothetical protein [Kaistia nematophila]
MLICADCGSTEFEDEDDDDGLTIVHRDDLGLAIHALTKGMGDEAARLPDVLTYLVRAIPDLHPIIALLERETGRKLAP